MAELLTTMLSEGSLTDIDPSNPDFTSFVDSLLAHMYLSNAATSQLGKTITQISKCKYPYEQSLLSPLDAHISSDQTPTTCSQTPDRLSFLLSLNSSLPDSFLALSTGHMMTDQSTTPLTLGDLLVNTCLSTLVLPGLRASAIWRALLAAGTVTAARYTRGLESAIMSNCIRQLLAVIGRKETQEVEDEGRPKAAKHSIRVAKLLSQMLRYTPLCGEANPTPLSRQYFPFLDLLAMDPVLLDNAVESTVTALRTSLSYSEHYTVIQLIGLLLTAAPKERASAARSARLICPSYFEDDESRRVVPSAISIGGLFPFEQRALRGITTGGGITTPTSQPFPSPTSVPLPPYQRLPGTNRRVALLHSAVPPIPEQYSEPTPEVDTPPSIVCPHLTLGVLAEQQSLRLSVGERAVPHTKPPHVHQVPLSLPPAVVKHCCLIAEASVRHLKEVKSALEGRSLSIHNDVSDQPLITDDTVERLERQINSAVSCLLTAGRASSSVGTQQERDSVEQHLLEGVESLLAMLPLLPPDEIITKGVDQQRICFMTVSPTPNLMSEQQEHWLEKDSAGLMAGMPHLPPGPLEAALVSVAEGDPDMYVRGLQRNYSTQQKIEQLNAPLHVLATPQIDSQQPMALDRLLCAVGRPLMALSFHSGHGTTCQCLSATGVFSQRCWVPHTVSVLMRDARFYIRLPELIRAERIVSCTNPIRVLGSNMCHSAVSARLTRKRAEHLLTIQEEQTMQSRNTKHLLQEVQAYKASEQVLLSPTVVPLIPGCPLRKEMIRMLTGPPLPPIRWANRIELLTPLPRASNPMDPASLSLLIDLHRRTTFFSSQYEYPGISARPHITGMEPATSVGAICNGLASGALDSCIPSAVFLLQPHLSRALLTATVGYAGGGVRRVGAPQMAVAGLTHALKQKPMLVRHPAILGVLIPFARELGSVPPRIFTRSINSYTVKASRGDEPARLKRECGARRDKLVLIVQCHLLVARACAAVEGTEMAIRLALTASTPATSRLRRFKASAAAAVASVRPRRILKQSSSAGADMSARNCMSFVLDSGHAITRGRFGSLYLLPLVVAHATQRFARLLDVLLVRSVTLVAKIWCQIKDEAGAYTRLCQAPSEHQQMTILLAQLADALALWLWACPSPPKACGFGQLLGQASMMLAEDEPTVHSTRESGASEPIPPVVSNGYQVCDTDGDVDQSSSDEVPLILSDEGLESLSYDARYRRLTLAWDTIAWAVRCRKFKRAFAPFERSGCVDSRLSWQPSKPGRLFSTPLPSSEETYSAARDMASGSWHARDTAPDPIFSAERMCHGCEQHSESVLTRSARVVLESERCTSCQSQSHSLMFCIGTHQFRSALVNRAVDRLMCSLLLVDAKQFQHTLDQERAERLCLYDCVRVLRMQAAQRRRTTEGTTPGSVSLINSPQVSARKSSGVSARKSSVSTTVVDLEVTDPHTLAVNPNQVHTYVRKGGDSTEIERARLEQGVMRELICPEVAGLLDEVENEHVRRSGVPPVSLDHRAYSESDV
eukprot:gnl/Dysnectes_brevis/6756_a10718_245.p1 GENE.gnl/Dysnectes_brevis/6756_a10718_245~~gnl/Dysnectes_brevis/6756_a10718_245.p1  ORF type:complete len:1620 (-),score=151.16 gnl/Dysnectes_brevis/6756_a10718_245:42-4598(-)